MIIDKHVKSMHCSRHRVIFFLQTLVGQLIRCDEHSRRQFHRSIRFIGGQCSLKYAHVAGEIEKSALSPISVASILASHNIGTVTGVNYCVRVVNRDGK